MKPFMRIDELKEYLIEQPSKATIYRWARLGLIPFFKRGNKLFFWREEIDEWENNDRKMKK